MNAGIPPQGPPQVKLCCLSSGGARGPGKSFESERLLSGVRIDEGIREDLASSISSAGIELHPETKPGVRESYASTAGDLPPLRRVNVPVSIHHVSHLSLVYLLPGNMSV